MAVRGFYWPGKADDEGGLTPGNEENAARRIKDRTDNARGFRTGLLYELD
jgi:hypothetical protein